MVELELRFIGDLEVLRDGSVMTLPPSKKTRALLAYLALNPRSFRREFLCELLWEVPDDPRGSLRWSLSKLRRLVDDDEHPRIIADRSSVRFDPAGVAIDVLALRLLAESGLAETDLATLEDAVCRFRGNFLEGLELANFHEFHSWYVAEREAVARSQQILLRHLLERLSAVPEKALPHARSLVALAPYDESARAALLRLLVAAGHTEEAEQQYHLGVHMLEEVGAKSSGALFRAWRGAPGSAGQKTEPGLRVDVEKVQPSRVASPAPLVGREQELDQLTAAFDRVTEQSSAQVVLIRGEPGIGKSRLMQALADRARAADSLILETSAFESETVRPFALWIDAFRRLGAGAGIELFDSTAQDNRDHLFASLSDLVSQESGTRPVVLIFDDLQWSDESSAAALHYVARMNRERPLLGVLAARDVEVNDNRAVQQALRGLRHDELLQELKLGPLPEAAVKQLIALRSPQADSETLSQECGGNPLLAIELARAQSAGDAAGSLDDLVRERMSRLDSDAAEVLRWAAVLGSRINIAALVRISGLDSGRIGEVLESAERQAMMQPTDRGFRFSHDLIARSIYNEISPARRRVMHRRVAEMLEQEAAMDLAHAADLSYHASRSGDPGLAARAMVSAGRLCLRFFANEDARKLAEKGLQLVTELSDSERVCRTLELRDILMAAAPLEDWQESADEFVALAEQALDYGALSHARLGYYMASNVSWMHGQWTGAREGALQSERMTRGGTDEQQIVGMAEAAECLAMIERDLDQAGAMLMEARGLAARRRFSHPALSSGLGILRFHENQLDEAEELFREARTLCKSAGDRFNEYMANEYLAMIDVERGHYDRALERGAALKEIGEKLREGSEGPFARAFLGLCRYALEDKEDQLEAGLADLRIADAKHRLAYILTRAALLDVERHRLESARARAQEALEYASLLQRATETALAHLALALTCREAGDSKGLQEQMAALESCRGAPVAKWARQRIANLLDLKDMPR